MLKNLLKQFNKKSCVNSAYGMTIPSVDTQDEIKKLFLKSQSKHALNLYERSADIKKFTELVLSDPENTDYEARVKEIIDIENLSSNKNLLDDLNL